MATFIDHVRCGHCDAGLTLEASSVVVQRYRHQPWLRHFWVRCEACVADKLYWPTARQVRLATLLKCPTNLADIPPASVARAYARSNRMPTVSHSSTVDIPGKELGFLLSMLAATNGPVPGSGAPTRSYLPPHWAN